jgi:hypothetical protein
MSPQHRQIPTYAMDDAIPERRRRYGPVHGGPNRATGDPRVVNERSALYGSPDEIAPRLEALRDVRVGCVLFNGGGSVGRCLIGPPRHGVSHSVPITSAARPTGHAVG